MCSSCFVSYCPSSMAQAGKPSVCSMPFLWSLTRKWCAQACSSIITLTTHLLSRAPLLHCDQVHIRLILICMCVICVSYVCTLICMFHVYCMTHIHTRTNTSMHTHLCAPRRFQHTTARSGKYAHARAGAEEIGPGLQNGRWKTPVAGSRRSCR